MLGLVGSGIVGFGSVRMVRLVRVRSGLVRCCGVR